jgi:hypothetical protein
LDPSRIAAKGLLLGNEGEELASGLWESAVYLGTDGCVYHLLAGVKKGHPSLRITAKRPVGEYLRWVDALFGQHELPAPANGIHYRAARRLREII